LSATQCSYCVSGLVKETARLFCILQQRPAGRCKRDIRATAIKQRDSELFFESFHLEADCRLGEIEIFRGLPKTEFFGDLAKYREPEVL
jgi:hypothetical protein